MADKTIEDCKAMTLKVAEALDDLGLTNGELIACIIAILAAAGRAASAPADVERIVVGLVLLTEELVAHRDTLLELASAKEENCVC